MSTAPQFAVIPGVQVQRVLDGHERHTAELVKAAYRLHGEGQTVNPRSYFLRFPDRPGRPDHRPARLARRRGAGRRHQVDLELPPKRRGRDPARLGGADPE